MNGARVPAHVAWGVAAVAALAQGALVAGALDDLPAPLRLALAFLGLVLVPGAGWVALGALPPGGPWLALGWAFGLGVAWEAALLALAHALGASFLVLAPWSPLTVPLPWLVVALVRPRTTGWEVVPRGPAILAVVLAAAYAMFHVARFGPPSGIATDTPDHVGTLRRMLETGALFPQDAFFKDAGRLGADPRKGLWHGVVALIAHLARLDPVEVWRGLPALVAPCFVLNAAALGMLVRGGAGAAVAAWALVLTYGGGVTRSPIRQEVFASRVGDHLALATIVAVLADLRVPTRARRAVTVALAFGAVAAHVFAIIQFAMVFGALALGVLIRDRRASPELRRLLENGFLIALACAPYLAFRAVQAYGPGNTIHTEPQGLLWLTDRWAVVSIGQLWDWMGIAWVLVPLAWPWLWTRERSNTAVLSLLTSSLAVALVMYNPLAVAVLQPRVGYLLMRMIWLVPFAGVLAWVLPELTASSRSAALRSVRVRAVLTLGGALLLLAPFVVDAARTVGEPGLVEARESSEEVRGWGDALAWMRDSLPRGTVALSDPATSYAIPMMTGHYVVTLVDQHSSPNDTLALRRILDARDALDPYGSWGTLRDVLRRHGASVIVLNDRFSEAPELDYWGPSPRWYDAARVRLDAHPKVFARVFDARRFTIYRVDRRALDLLPDTAAARPFVVRRTSGSRLTPMGDGLPGLAGFRLVQTEVAPGDTLTGIAEWVAEQSAPAGSYRISVRFDRPLPDGIDPPDLVRKPARKLVERMRRERYRFREDHLPTEGQYGVDLWSPDEVVRDSFTLRVPLDVADGTYRVEVRMHRQPHFPNLRLSDYFLDDDYFSGVPVGTLEVRRRPPGSRTTRRPRRRVSDARPGVPGARGGGSSSGAGRPPHETFARPMGSMRAQEGA